MLPYGKRTFLTMACFHPDKRVLKNCSIYQMLKNSAKKKHLAFHMPGHKAGKWDITELSYSDNLSAPRGCIAKAEEDIARILGAKKSFILTDGSTSGVLAMLYAASRMGVKKIALPVRAHKSVQNGCRLASITPLFYTDDEYSAVSQADGILVISPDYFGNLADLALLRSLCDREKKLLLVDGAHGGHLHFQKDLHAGGYADFWVDGVHKTLPALTQGAVVSARTEQGAAALFEGVNIFRTTSPSYPIMASVEYAIKYPRNERLELAVYDFMQTCERAIYTRDWTKLAVDFGAHARKINEELERKGVFAELCDEGRVLFYLSPATSLRDFKRLTREIDRLLKKHPYEELKRGEKVDERVPAPLEIPEIGRTEWVRLECAEGRICAAECGLFPPCTPLLLRGERISREKIEKLRGAVNVYGLMDGKISVFTTNREEE